MNASRPLHVVVVVDHAHVNGGQAKVAIDSAAGLARRGHRVTLFAAVAPADPSLADAGVSVVLTGQPDAHTATSTLAYSLQAMWNRTAAARLAALLATCDPASTVVHVHGFAKALSPAIGPVITRSRLPAVITLHEFFLVCPNGGFFDFPRNAACRRTPMSLACITHNCDSRSYVHKAYRVVRQGVIDRLSGLHDAFGDVITISHLQRSVAEPLLPKGLRWHHVDNPVPVSDPGPRDPDSAVGEFLFVGRLSPEKGAPLFLEAARRVGVTAVVVGDGQDGPALRGAYPEARFLGWQSGEAVREAMRKARALVFPSVWYEGQPLTVLEALAMGTPVIVSDICAGRESVVDGESGLHVQGGSVDALADALSRLRDDAVARAMGQAAYARYWADPLTLDRHLDRIEAVYAGARAAGIRAAA
ncbi:glycosyltransferase family 4 protein [Alsobacter sp. R-9]